MMATLAVMPRMKGMTNVMMMTRQRKSGDADLEFDKVDVEQSPNLPKRVDVHISLVAKDPSIRTGDCFAKPEKTFLSPENTEQGQREYLCGRHRSQCAGEQGRTLVMIA